MVNIIRIGVKFMGGRIGRRSWIDNKIFYFRWVYKKCILVSLLYLWNYAWFLYSCAFWSGTNPTLLNFAESTLPFRDFRSPRNSWAEPNGPYMTRHMPRPLFGGQGIQRHQLFGGWPRILIWQVGSHMHD